METYLPVMIVVFFFEYTHDLQTHVKRSCPENVSLKGKRSDGYDEDETPSKRFLVYSDEEKENQVFKQTKPNEMVTLDFEILFMGQCKRLKAYA